MPNDGPPEKSSWRSTKTHFFIIRDIIIFIIKDFIMFIIEDSIMFIIEDFIIENNYIYVIGQILYK